MIGRSDDRHINYHTDNKVGFEWLFLCFMAKDLLSGYRAPHPPTTPNSSKVDSGTRRQALRAAILSAPYIANVSMLASKNHITKGCEVKMQPNAAKMSSK